MREAIGSLVIVCMLVFTSAAVGAKTARHNDDPLCHLNQGMNATGICNWDPTQQIPPGVITFNPLNPGQVSGLYAWDPDVNWFSRGMTYDLAGNLYMSNTSGFFQIDTATWNITLLGTSDIYFTALACDPTTGIVYAAGGHDWGTDLYTVNTTTGEATHIGAFDSGGYVSALACDENGTMYCIDMATTFFYSVNKNTAATSLIGPLGVEVEFTCGMSYQLSDNKLYLAAFHHYTSLYQVDLQTGGCTDMGHFQGYLDIEAFCFPLSEPDTTPPTTTCTIDGTYPVTITLVADDDGGSGVNYTMYRIDGGPWMIYTGEPIIITEPGAHTIDFYSVDNAGNAETIRTAPFTVVFPLTISIKGGLGITAIISNGWTNASDITWNINVTGLAFPKNKHNTEAGVAPGSSITAKSVLIGFGPLSITVEANNAEKTATGFIFLIFVIGVK